MCCSPQNTENSPTKKLTMPFCLTPEEQQQAYASLTAKQRREIAKVYNKQHKHLVKKQQQAIKKYGDPKFFKGEENLPLVFQLQEDVRLSPETDPEAYVRALEKFVKMRKSNKSLDYAQVIVSLLWLSAFIMKCYSLGSFSMFFVWLIGFFLLGFQVLPQLKMLGNRAMDIMLILNFARFVATYLDAGGAIAAIEEGNSPLEIFFLLLIPVISGLIVGVLVCHVLVFVVLAKILNVTDPSKWNWFLILCGALHFCVAVYCTVVDANAVSFW